jgi:hypothetical protein
LLYNGEECSFWQFGTVPLLPQQVKGSLDFQPSLSSMFTSLLLEDREKGGANVLKNHKIIDEKINVQVEVSL